MPRTTLCSGRLSAARRLRCYWTNYGFPATDAAPDPSTPLTIKQFLGGTESVAKLRWPAWDSGRLDGKLRVVHTKEGTEVMNRLNRVIDAHGLAHLGADPSLRALLYKVLPFVIIMLFPSFHHSTDPLSLLCPS